MPEFSDNLRHLRGTRHLTRPQLSQAVGISVTALGGYETGKVFPTLPKMCMLADYFGVTLDSLVGREEMKLTDVHKVFNALTKIYQSVKRIEEKDDKQN